MEVGGILAPGALKSTLLGQFHVGERLLVEVVQKASEGEGTIRVKGQELSAILESQTEVGEKFWVKVGNLSKGSLLLIREPLMEQKGNTQVALPQFKQLTERGLPINQEIITLLKTFPTANPGILSLLLTTLQETTLQETTSQGTTSQGTPSQRTPLQGAPLDALIMNFRKFIPEWNGLLEENGAEKLVECLRKLGLNYEQRILQMLKLDASAKEIEKKSLKETLKFALLEAIQNQEGLDIDDSDGPLAHLLQKITGQQLWFKTGAQDSAFMLLQLPLLNQGQPMPVQIAIESARKGPKMDEQHCRIALQIETLQLGDIGIDAYFDHDSVAFRVLSHNLPFLPQLLEEVMPETRAGFSKLGFNIEKVETGDLDKNIEFQNFLRGIRRSGVDVQR